MCKVIVVGGPQGCGKGYNIENFVKNNPELRIAVISVGDILREEGRKATKLGEKAKWYMNKGKLVPNRIINRLVRKAVKTENDTADLIFIDGYPRNSPQARYIKRKIRPDMVIYLDVPEEISLERVSRRVICQKCGKAFDKTKLKDGTCEDCGGDVAPREDESELAERLRIFKKYTRPALGKCGVPVVEIPGDSPEVCHYFQKEVLNCLQH